MSLSHSDQEVFGTWLEHMRSDDLRSLADEALRRMSIRYGSADGGDGPPRPDRKRIDTLARACFASDPDDARRRVAALIESGLPISLVYNHYLGPAAARLGTLWDENLLSFIDVTRGVARIIVMMRELRLDAPVAHITHDAPILFATVPGETHALGISMATDLFRENGWDVKLLTGKDHDTLADTIEQTDARALGLSCSSETTVGALARLILATRLIRPSLPILVSGKIATEKRALVEAMGPDAIVTSIPSAIGAIEELTEGPSVKSK